MILNALTLFHVLLSLVGIAAIAYLARYRSHLAGPWRRTYAITAVIALYFNVFALIAQLFQNVPTLKALAPTQSEPPFLITQLAVLSLFVLQGIRAAIKFRPDAAKASAAALSR